MTPRLEWPGFRLDHDAGVLHLRWSDDADLEVRAERCIEASLRSRSAEAASELVLRFRSAELDTADLIVVRAGVPAAHVPHAEQLIALLRREHAVPDRPTEEDETAELARVPEGAPGWVLAPAGSASEDLFAVVMHRIDNDSENDAG